MLTGLHILTVTVCHLEQAPVLGHLKGSLARPFTEDFPSQATLLSCPLALPLEHAYLHGGPASETRYTGSEGGALKSQAAPLPKGKTEAHSYVSTTVKEARASTVHRH